MAEYIEREAAIIGLAASSLMPHQIDDAAEALQLVPAADVAPVVRCKDCKYSAVDFENMRYCKLVTYYNHVPDDWFCADGERKDGDGDV